MSYIKENLIRIRASIPEHVTLVAVSKTKPTTDLLEAYQAGQRVLVSVFLEKIKFRK